VRDTAITTFVANSGGFCIDCVHRSPFASAFSEEFTEKYCNLALNLFYCELGSAEMEYDRLLNIFWHRKVDPLTTDERLAYGLFSDVVRSLHKMKSQFLCHSLRGARSISRETGQYATNAAFSTLVSSCLDVY
jgi:hypothetical protein